ncbi:flagellar biosynthesis protein FlgJ [Mesorhizobium sp. Root157]|uniref:rod-binding protein n=1 Tax=Mesorhizobium sp. Root157 TaxID=1736477 RepID=UPI0006F8228E|nr:rod-binding protein [Mesorhizobium sp. Root157]KQZ86984.1 flagellar biosynthesis protein FlgJ [Mesorhizobium sp. Root157]
MLRDDRTDNRQKVLSLAISPPSDIVLDVARAANPADIQQARAQLMQRTGASAEPFSVTDAPMLSRTASKDTPNPSAENFKQFEAMVLQTFIQNMLPKDAEGVYGKGLAGDMWKSQLAEHLAGVVADNGGIGIARSLAAAHYLDGKRKVPIGPVSTSPQKTEIDERARLSTSLVQEFQMKIARTLSDDQASAVSKKV